MASGTLLLARYRFRTTFRQRWTGYLTIVLLVGLIGGLAMASVAAGRRTASSFTTYLASTNPADVRLFTGFANPALGGVNGYDPGVINRIDHLPFVRASATIVGFNGNMVFATGIHSHSLPGQSPPSLEGSPDGLGTTLDRPQVLQGRLADPNRPGEVVINRPAAAQLGLHVGSKAAIGFETDAQADDNYSGTDFKVAKLTVVGIIETSDQIIEDQVDTLGSGVVLFSRALTRQLDGDYATFSGVELQVKGGSANVSRVVAEASRLIPKGLSSSTGASFTSTHVALAQRTLRPLALALEVFGVLAGLAALLIGAQALLRQLRIGATERSVLRSLGTSPAMTLGDGLSGLLAATVAGTVLAVGVAVLLSPIGPIGPVRPVYPTPGFTADWPVLGAGALVLLVGVSAIATVAAVREAPERSHGRRRVRAREAGVVTAAANAGMSVPAVTGLRFAVEPGTGRNAVPVRSAIVGTVLAGLILTATFTFGTSLSSLVSHPALYGWNWEYEMLSGYSGAEDLPAHQLTTLLDRDPYVATWTGVYFVTVHLDGVPVPALATRTDPVVAPPLLSGHGLDGSDQVVLGAATLRLLHKSVGDTVVLDSRTGVAHTLTIVGTATMPTVGSGSEAHLEMGTGALVSSSLFSTSTLNLQESTVPGPNAVFVRIRDGSDPAAALLSLHRIDAAINAVPADNQPAGGVVGVLRPAEIVDYGSIGDLPAYLGLALAAGAVVALGLTLVASVRRRRHDLALLKTLGLTGRQLAAIVSWQSCFAVAVGMVVGIPLGVIVGRTLWDLFAHEINAVAAPSVPALVVVVIAAGGLVVANLVAAVPGRIAARTPTAVVLRSE
jgi:ABC-type antimicrobial peptide transport system permease subunit